MTDSPTVPKRVAATLTHSDSEWTWISQLFEWQFHVCPKNVAISVRKGQQTSCFSSCLVELELQRKQSIRQPKVSWQTTSELDSCHDIKWTTRIIGNKTHGTSLTFTWCRLKLILHPGGVGDVAGSDTTDRRCHTHNLLLRCLLSSAQTAVRKKNGNRNNQ